MKAGCGILGTLIMIVAACGGGGEAPPDSGPRDWPEPAPDPSTVPEPGVRRDQVLVAGAVPPPNPDTMEQTPAELNFTQVLRYRQDVDPPAPPRAILIAYPGFLGGAGSWDPLARALIKRGAAAGQVIEVWAIDRRANLLEDLRGSEAAEEAGDPEVAWHWYFGADTVGGERFPGFQSPSDVGFMSEWGLATHVEDLRRVIELVPPVERRGRVFLLGHSMGASFAEAYAAWRFTDGRRGADDLAGIVLIDGVLAESPIDEATYLAGTGGTFSPTGAGLEDIRSNSPYFMLPLLGLDVFPGIEIMSMRMLAAPDAIVRDDIRDTALRVLLSYGAGPLPAFTNEAALGFGFDDESNGLSFAAVSAGHSDGGALDSYESPFFGNTLVHPTDENATYTWIDAAEDDPPELTPLANVAHAFTDGDTNFAEWYFPARLTIDLAAVGGGNVEGSWQETYGLLVLDGSLIDAPILAVSAGAGLVAASEYEPLRARVASIGPGRPNAGATRDQDVAFRVITFPGATHVDPLTAAEGPANPMSAEIESFVEGNAAAGSVTVTLP